MVHFLKLNTPIQVSQLRILTSISVPFRPTTVQMPQLALIETKRITVHLLTQSLPVLVVTRIIKLQDCQYKSRNSPEFDPSILRHSGIWGVAGEAVLNIVHTKKLFKKTQSIKLQYRK
jgi:hypothetical protein